MTRPHLLDALRDRVLLCDGGMGSRVQALTLDIEKDYWGRENCTDVLVLSRPDMVREIHHGYFAAGADMVETNTFGGSPVTLGEFDLADRAFEINKIAGELAREAAEAFADGRHRWVIGSVGPGTKLPSLGNIAYDPLEAALAEQCRGLIAGGVDAILIETCQDTLQIKAAVNGAKIARARRRHGHPDLRPGHRRNHRHAAGRPRHRRRRRRGQRAGRAADGAELRHRPAGNGRTCRLARRQLARPDLRPAQRRPARTRRRPHPLSARRRRPRLLAGALHPAGRRQPDRRLLRHLDRAHRRARRHAAQARRLPPGPGRAQADLGPRRRQPVSGGAAAAGKRHLRHRRALQRQRLEEMARTAGKRRLGRLRRHGPRADRRRLARARHLHRLRRPRRKRGNDRGHPPLHRLGEQPAGHRQHRNPGDRGRAEAARRQADHQLDQLRGWRAARHRPPDPGQALRRRGHRADHRRGRHGEDGRGQAAHRPPAGRFRLQQARPGAIRPADRPADLHHRHRQRGRPQAGAMDAGRHRRHPRRIPRHPDHPRPVQRQLRPESRRPRRAEQRVPRPRQRRPA